MKKWKAYFVESDLSQVSYGSSHKSWFDGRLALIEDFEKGVLGRHPTMPGKLWKQLKADLLNYAKEEEDMIQARTQKEELKLCQRYYEKSYKIPQDLVPVKATQWFKNGDHPLDESELMVERGFTEFVATTSMSEGKVVRRYRNPKMDSQDTCPKCTKIMHLHGWIDKSRGGITVCPGDWIITGENGAHYPCGPRNFETSYTLLGETDEVS